MVGLHAPSDAMLISKLVHECSHVMAMLIHAYMSYHVIYGTNDELASAYDAKIMSMVYAGMHPRYETDQ